MPSTTALRSYWHRRPTTPPVLHINLFGHTTCLVNHTPITPQLWRNRRAFDLLLHLLNAERHTLARTVMTSQLWPDLDDKSAANNLRVSLHRLRNILAEATPQSDTLLVATPHYIMLTIPTGSSVDALEFAETVQRIRLTRDVHYALPLLRRACDLYRGNYLADQPPDDWIFAVREHYATAFADMSLRLGRILLDKHLHPELIERMWHLLHHDPSSEGAHQLLMQSYLATGNHDMVRRVYQSCQTMLWQHLGLHPHHHTTAIYTQVSSG
ncbi:MAG: hypothetical protein RL076_2304 [Chloroflexota bacterium]|jgi:DNA-binding SARP family transcriptional activator